MNFGFVTVFLLSLILTWALPARAQDLGPGFTKVRDGIYTFAPDATTTTCSFVVTQEGVVMIDSCNSPLDSRKMLAAIKKVTDKPILFLIDTETDTAKIGWESISTWRISRRRNKLGGHSRELRAGSTECRSDWPVARGGRQINPESSASCQSPRL